MRSELMSQRIKVLRKMLKEEFNHVCEACKEKEQYVHTLLSLMVTARAGAKDEL